MSRLDANHELWPRFGGQLFHVTNYEGYKGICLDGEIRPNDGSFPSTYGISDRSVCRDLGGVSLFDLTEYDALPSEVIFPGLNDILFASGNRPVSITLLLDRHRLEGSMLSNNELNRLCRERQVQVANPEGDIETCYRGAIPVEAVKQVISVYHFDSLMFVVSDDLPSLSEIERFNIDAHDAAIAGKIKIGISSEPATICRIVADLEGGVLTAYHHYKSGYEGVSDYSEKQLIPVPDGYEEIYVEHDTLWDREEERDVGTRLMTDVRTIEFKHAAPRSTINPLNDYL